jgi:hypothetical protein
MKQRSQEIRILEILQAAGSTWTPAPVLSRVSLQYCRAIAALRHGRGIQIENRVQTVNGTRHGFYRLVLKPVTVRPRNSPPETLFGEGGHRDDG